MPTPAARHASPAGVFRDPVKERRSWTGPSSSSKRWPIACAPSLTPRAGLQGKKLVLFFYGYLRVRRRGEWTGHLRALRLAPGPRLPGHRHPLLADLLLRSRPRRQRALDERRRERRARGQDVAQRGRHAHLSRHRHAARLARSRHHARGDQRRTHPQCRPGSDAQFRHVVDGPGRHRLVSRPRHVAADGKTQRAG